MNPGAPPDPEAARLAAETIGDLMAFWGFRRSMGVVWTVLYLHARPMTQEEIVAATGLSMGSVSMTLTDLEHWGLALRHPLPVNRRRTYVAETDIRSVVFRVLRERELRKIGEAVGHLSRAATQLRASGPEDPAREEHLLMADRAGELAELARLGEVLIGSLARAGHVDLGPIPDLARRKERTGR